MSRFFIIHGVGGHPGENWFPWLKSELEKQGEEVIIPQFPTPKNQTLDNWLKVMENYEITPDSTLIGHSLGVPFVLNLIEKHPVKSAYLVAGFYGIAGNEFDESMKTFAQRDFDWEKIRQNCKDFTVFHSDNDPYIKIEKAYELADKLHITPQILKGAGHINSSAGYNSFQELLDAITSQTSQ
ncbi:alpha/beta hydrolase [Patescibacteria group bacterium]|nr:alpha/beta hydrolase [Patescibacteria group bacterium]